MSNFRCFFIMLVTTGFMAACKHSRSETTVDDSMKKNSVSQRNTEAGQGLDETSFCQVKDHLPIPDRHQRYEKISVYYAVKESSNLWEPSKEQMSSINRMIPQCLAKDYCNYQDPIYERGREKAKEVLENLSEYWFFYNGIIRDNEKLVIYGFFRPGPGEVEALGGVDATWDYFIANIKGGGTKYWQAHYNLETGECRTHINSSR